MLRSIGGPGTSYISLKYRNPPSRRKLPSASADQAKLATRHDAKCQRRRCKVAARSAAMHLL
eukprot:690482-Rhodomonas_salina.3